MRIRDKDVGRLSYRSLRNVSIWRLSCVTAVLASALAISCDDGASCPANPCDPASDGVRFDVLGWCEESGGCLRNGAQVPVCKDADASPAPSCALEQVDGSETLTFPIGELWPMLGGRHDLVVTFTSCDDVARPPDLQEVQIRLDGEPAACQPTNPCDPAGLPTLITCLGVSATVQSITFSFIYDGAEGSLPLQVQMEDAACSYFCGPA